MIKDACEVRDKVVSLLIEGDVKAALEVAQTLTVLGSDQEFNCFMEQLLAVALNDTLQVAGAYPDRRVERHATRLTPAQQTWVCNAVGELRKDREYNTAVLAVPVC